MVGYSAGVTGRTVRSMGDPVAGLQVPMGGVMIQVEEEGGRTMAADLGPGLDQGLAGRVGPNRMVLAKRAFST